MSTHQSNESFFDRLRLDGSWEGKGWNTAVVLGTLALFSATIAKVVTEIGKEAKAPSVQAPFNSKDASPSEEAPETRLSDAKKSRVITEV